MCFGSVFFLADDFGYQLYPHWKRASGYIGPCVVTDENGVNTPAECDGKNCCEPAYPEVDDLMPTMTDIFRTNGIQNEYHYAFYLCAPSRVSILVGRVVNQVSELFDLERPSCSS